MKKEINLSRSRSLCPKVLSRKIEEIVRTLSAKYPVDTKSAVKWAREVNLKPADQVPWAFRVGVI